MDRPSSGVMPSRPELVVLRMAVALLLFIHGVARVRLGIVDDFGLFLDSKGLPLGLASAWILTLVEIVGGATLAWGRLIRPLALFFIVELAAGIALVHAEEGWFVVGAGRNGVEYSLLLIVVLAVVAWAAPPRRGREGAAQ